MSNKDGEPGNSRVKKEKIAEIIMNINRKVEDYRGKHEGLVGLVEEIKERFGDMGSVREDGVGREKGENEEKGKEIDKLMNEIKEWKDKEKEWKGKEELIKKQIIDLDKEIEEGKEEMKKLEK